MEGVLGTEEHAGPGHTQAWRVCSAEEVVNGKKGVCVKRGKKQNQIT